VRTFQLVWRQLRSTQPEFCRRICVFEHKPRGSSG
jgi:hypothetical protein